MSLKTIDKNIQTIVTNANKLNTLIHETAMLIVRHAQEHGDCTRALSLVKAMPASMRRTMLVLWFNTFTPIRVVEANDKVGILPKTSKNYVDWDVKGADATPFYELAERNPEKSYDFEALVKMVASLAKRIEKKVEEGSVEEADRDSALALSEQLAHLRIRRVKANDNGEKKAAARKAA